MESQLAGRSFSPSLAAPADRYGRASTPLHPITATVVSQKVVATDAQAVVVISAKREINISGKQLLVALVAAFCFAGPLVWSLVRWLFAP